jgi:tripartite-type tricarboxylate transporter receptor subunit TctC
MKSKSSEVQVLESMSENGASRRNALRAMVATALYAGAGGSAWASTYPDKPIRLIVPFSAGGATDILGRLLGRAIEPGLGQTVVVENRLGAAGAIGATGVAKAAPDGYSVLLGGVGTNIVLALTQPSLHYDPVTDLIPVSYICNVDYVLAVAADSPYKTLSDLIEAARKKPNSVSYMSTGQRGPLHVALEYLSKRAGVKMIHVPYKGESPAYPDLITNRIDVAVMTVPFTKPRVADGSLRVLATISAQRAAAMPDVPTVAELGYEGYAVPIWNGFFVPKGTPQQVIDTLNAASEKILQDPALRERMVGMGLTPTGGTAAEYAAFLSKERERWALMIDETGVLQN